MVPPRDKNGKVFAVSSIHIYISLFRAKIFIYIFLCSEEIVSALGKAAPKTWLLCSICYRVRSTTDETVKTTWNSLNMTIPRLHFVSNVVFLIVRQSKKHVYSCRESLICGNRQYKFRTVVSEVSSIEGNLYPWEEESKEWNPLLPVK